MRLVMGCRVEGTLQPFPHRHPTIGCAICAYLEDRQWRRVYAGLKPVRHARYRQRDRTQRVERPNA